MKKTAKDTSGPIRRFFAGFFLTTFVTFLGVLHSTRGVALKEDFLTACIASPITGTVVGILSAFGKKVLQFSIAFFTQAPL
jgi:hypothetical protein